MGIDVFAHFVIFFGRYQHVLHAHLWSQAIPTSSRLSTSVTKDIPLETSSRCLVNMSYKRSRQTFEADLQKQTSPFVLYGTALPPLDEHTRDDGSFVPIWKQEVTDERGRKRLHGAFTGGFSAG